MVTLQLFVALWVTAVAAAQRVQRYYNIHDMPVTSFDCRDKILGGYYADPEANCQMFHVCVKIPGQGVSDFRFLCPNETVFDQEQQICADSGEIDCAASGLFLDNFDLYRLDSLQAKRPISFSSKGTPIPLGPSTKSPILTNQVQDDDDFYLQRSETGDRRLHSKDLLRGSSSSNLFNSRNRGKDLDDDDDDDVPRTVNEAPQSYRPKPAQQSRGKSQYNTQFRSTSPTTTSTTTTTTTTPAPRITEDKKRTKVAVRKLARKRPTTPEEVRSTPATFTTQVTQRFSFGEQDQRYSTINRSPATSSPFQQPSSKQYQQNFRNKVQTSTVGNFQPNYQQQGSPSTSGFQQGISQTTPAYQPNYQQQSAQTTPAYQTNYQQQNAKSTSSFQPNYQQNNEQPSTPAFFEPSNNVGPTSRPGGFNGRPIVAGNNFQQPNRQTLPPITSSTPTQNQQYNRPQQQSTQQPQNQQFNRPQQSTQQPQNQQFNRAQQQNFNSNQQQNQNNFNNQQQNNNNQQSFSRPQQSTQQPQNNFQNQDFSRIQPKQQPQQNNFPNNNNDFSRLNQQSRQPTQQPQSRPQNQQNQFQSRQTVNYNRPSSTTPAFQQRSSTIPPNINAQTINAALQPRPTPNNNQRQSFRNDDFDDGDQQEFLKTAHSSNFRPSDINSFSNTYKSNGDKTEATKDVSTTKYYTPTIVTTPKPATASSTAQPKPSSQPAVQSSDKEKDTSYDYAYYDDGGAFSEYDALDALGETDFSRTSQRTKSRLI